MTKDGEKYTKRKVNYEPNGGPYTPCGECVMFVKPDACTAVEGDISPFGTCDIWEGEEHVKQGD